MDKKLVSTFMEVTSCASQADAVRHLGSCHWNLDEAINLYFSNACGGSSTETEPPSRSSADPILPGDDVPTKEDKDHGDAIRGGHGDDVRAPPYYGDRSTGTAVGAPFVVDAPSLSLSEIVPMGWGDAETDDAGVSRAENDDDDDDDAEQDDNNIGTKEDGGGSDGEGDGEYNDDEDYDNMSYIEEEDDDDDDDDDAYYAFIADGTDGDHRPAVQPPQPLGKESLQDLFQPPYELMYRGSFHAAKVHAARNDRFLLANLQTSGGAGDFPSLMQNRDLWADEAVKSVVEDSFVFFWIQTTGGGADSHLDECMKLAGFYRLDEDQLPAVLVVDPITGQLLARRSGAMMPDEFVQFVDEYMKSNPSAISMPKFAEKTPPPVFPASSAADAGGEQEPAWGSDAAAAVEQETPAPAPADDEVGGEQEREIPNNSGAAAAGGDCSEREHVPVPNDTTDELPAEMIDDDEPMEDEEMYRLRIRFPDGTMVAKEFGCKRRVASLLAFCRSALHGGGQRAEEEKKAIRVMRFAGRALVPIQDDDAGATFEDLGLNYAAVSVVFDA